jgi:hypothetical protein
MEAEGERKMTPVEALERILLMSKFTNLAPPEPIDCAQYVAILIGAMGAIHGTAEAGLREKAELQK